MIGDGRVIGTYLLGLFASSALRAAFLARLGGKSTLGNYQASVNDALDRIAAQLEEHADIDALIDLAMS
jgi:adenosylcobyric acid synthase